MIQEVFYDEDDMMRINMMTTKKATTAKKTKTKTNTFFFRLKIVSSISLLPA